MPESTDNFRMRESARCLEDDFSIEIPLKVLMPTRYRIAVVAHIFYPSATPRIRLLLDNIDGFQKLFISTDSLKSQRRIEHYLNQFEPIDYMTVVTENRGRDLPSKTTLFNKDISSFDLVLFLHSKKSKHSELLGTWCDYLFETLAGDASTVESIKTLFALSPRLGLVAPQHYELMRQFVNWGHNFTITQALLKKAGINISNEQPNDFPSGMMFWVRPQALASLHSLNIGIEDFSTDNSLKDGTLAHGIERAMFYLCEASNYQWIKVAKIELSPNTPGVLPSGSEEELIKALRKAHYSLTQNEPHYTVRAPLREHITQVPPALIAKIHKHELYMQMSLPMIDISLVTFNSEKWLKSLIKSIVNQDYPLEKINFYINDCASTDQTVPELHRLLDGHNFHSFRIDSSDNIGFGAGQNLNIAKGRSELVLVINPDLELEPNAITSAVNFALKDNSKVACWEFRQKPYEHPKLYSPFDLTTSWSSSACILFRRAAFEEVGGYDDNIFMYCEDVDLSWRLRAYGYTLRYLPKAVCWHHTYSESKFKETQFIGSIIGNLSLRARFGTDRDVKTGEEQYKQVTSDLKKSNPNLLKKLINAKKELNQKMSKFTKDRIELKTSGVAKFVKWDYEDVRLGAFYELQPNQAEHKSVSIIIRTYKGRLIHLNNAIRLRTVGIPITATLMV